MYSSFKLDFFIWIKNNMNKYNVNNQNDSLEYLKIVNWRFNIELNIINNCKKYENFYYQNKTEVKIIEG